MRILLIGATGMVGSRIAAEALNRGHQVTAATRSGGAPVDNPNLTAIVADAGDPTAVTEAAVGHDVVASALAPTRDGSDPVEPFLAVNESLIEGVRAAGLKRLAVVGGSGSLEIAPAVPLISVPGFPDKSKPEALAQSAVLGLYRGVADLDWTYLSPAAELTPGERTGAFRIDGDRLLTDDAGDSRISAEDYAIAFVDEIEVPEHTRERFSVAY